MHKLYKLVYLSVGKMEQNLCNESFDGNATYIESPAFEISKALRNLGYNTTNTCSFYKSDNQNYEDSGEIGIFEPKEKPKGFLNFLKSKKRDLYVGSLYLNNVDIGALVDNKWILSVYGRDNVQKLTNIVKKFVKSNVKLEVRLESEEPKIELSCSDDKYPT